MSWRRSTIKEVNDSGPKCPSVRCAVSGGASGAQTPTLLLLTLNVIQGYEIFIHVKRGTEASPKLTPQSFL